MNEQKEPKIPLILKGGIKFKEWFKKTSKITILFLTISLTTGITGLVLGSIAHNKTNGYQSFLGHDYTVYWGGDGTIIWSHKINNGTNINLYFDIKSHYDEDVKWDGHYPKGYFDNN